MILRASIILFYSSILQAQSPTKRLWGLAAVDSYRAYKDQGSLTFAESIWTQLSKYMITPSQAIAGTHPLKTSSFPPTCNGGALLSLSSVVADLSSSHLRRSVGRRRCLFCMSDFRLAVRCLMQFCSYLATPQTWVSTERPLRTLVCYHITSSSLSNSFRVGLSWRMLSMLSHMRAGADFSRLSARLFEATLEPQYQAAAELSAAFIQSQMYDGAVIMDAIDVASCYVSTLLVTYNSGFTIEGLSVLASKSASWTPLLVRGLSLVPITAHFYPVKLSLESLVSTVIPFSSWTNTSDGVNTEGNA